MTRLAAFLVLLAAAPARPADPRRFEYEEPHMGTKFRVILHAPDQSAADAAAKAAFARIEELNRVMSDYLPDSELMRLGLALGADVPFFLFGRNALGEGVGERLQALDLAPAWYLVLVPQVSVSTKEIFADASLTRDTERLKILPFLSGLGRNDLEAVVTARYPAVASHLAWLRSRVPGARMTGSGACVFAEFKNESEARALLSEKPAAMRGFVTRGLERHPLLERLNTM